MKSSSLGEIATFLSGGTPSRAVEEYWSGQIPWISGADISDHGNVTPRNFVTKEGIDKSAVNVVPPGTLLLVTRTSVGKSVIAPFEMGFSQDITAIFPDSKFITSQYLQAFLDFYAPKLKADSRGATIQGVNRKDVESIQVPLPEISEQSRIVSILSLAKQLVDKRHRIQVLLSEIADSVFAKLNAGNTTSSLQMKDIFAVSGGKRLPKGEPFASEPTNHPYLRVSDMRGGYFSKNRIQFITDEIHSKISRYTVDENDIVISIAGTIGEAAIVPNSLAGANLTENAAKLHPKQNDLNIPFIHRLIRTKEIQDQLVSATGKATIGKLPLFRIEEVKVDLPELAIQDEIMKKISEIEFQLAKSLIQQSILDEFYQTLQSIAFKGEL